MPSWSRLGVTSHARRQPRRGRSRKPELELLEDRTVPSPLVAGTTSLHTTEGSLYGTVLTKFTDGNTADTTANFTATISWGDGNSSSGTVSGSGGQFTVSGQHAYAEEGNYPLSVLIAADNGDSVTAGAPPVWTPFAATLPTPREGLGAATGADGRVYAIGGYNLDAGGYLAEVDAYDPVTQTWTAVAPLPDTRGYLAATSGTDGTVYAVAGHYAFGRATYSTNEFDAYNPATNGWTQLAGLPAAREGLAATTGADGTIYAIGGAVYGMGPAGYSAEVDAYNPATNTWTVLPPLPTARYLLAAAAGADGTIYAIGGVTASGLSDEVDAYDPATQTWTQVQSLPSARGYLAATAGTDGNIYAIGGVDAVNGVSGEVDVYNPSRGIWTPLASSLPTKRLLPAATTGSDGTIYALSGFSARGWTTEVDTYLPPATG
jgi:N-acetylneuraminic acid mutarotase